MLARVGIGSRRACEELIAAGRVRVDGDVAVLGRRIDLQTARVEVDGALVPVAPGLVYYLLNKPDGAITTADDPQGRPTVMTLVPPEPRVFPVGRLDRHTEGLLILTNDGALAQKLTKAGSHVPKTYLVKISGKPAAADIACLRAGVTIELDDGRRVKTSPASIQLVEDAPNPWYEVVLIEGRNRQIRRMFAVVGFQVEKIKRTKIGPLELDVEPGKFRALTVREVAQLKAL